MGFWENTSIGKYFGTNKKTLTVNGQVINMEADVLTLDAFSMGGSTSTFYNENTDFIKVYEDNFIVNSIISKISSKFSSVKFLDEKNSRLLDKINNPNNYQSKDEFLKEFSSFVLAAGFTAIWKKYISFGNFQTMELININPSKCHIDLKKESISFEYKGNTESVLLTEVILFYDTRQNNTNKKGYSRLIPYKSQIDNINLVQKAKNIQVQNSGTTIVSPKQVSAGSNIDEGLNTPVPVMGGNLITQKEEMEDKLNNRGLSNRIIVSSKGLDAINLSEKLNNIDFNKIVEPDAMVLYDAYNFDKELTPFGKDSTYDNKGESELKLYESEIFPLANNFINSLNAEFEGKGKLDLSYDHVGVMSIVKNRIIDTNEKLISQYNLLLDKEIINAVEYKKILIENKILNEN